jgi:hypothetical protein
MTTQKVEEYKIERKAKNVASTEWIELPGENRLARRLIRLIFIRDYKDASKFRGIHLELLYQNRTSEKDSWPVKTIDLRSVPKKLGFKFSLDSDQTKEVLERLRDAYPIGSADISSGKRVVLRGVGKNEVVVTESNKIAILKELSQALSQEDIDNWLKGHLSFVSSNIALAKIYQDRTSEIKEFKANIASDKNEDYWKAFLKRNKWMFGSAYVSIIDEERIDIHHETDLPFETEGGYMDIIEIKRPSFPFWVQKTSGDNYLYRGKFLIPHIEVQGAISQLSKYILQAEKKVDISEYIKDHGGIIPLKPKGLIVHGRSDSWQGSEWETFRLLNDRLHNIQIITFDILLERAARILQIMQAEQGLVQEEIVEIPKMEDIPF